MRHVLVLPYPPSVNALFTPIARGKFARIIKTKAYRDYSDAVGQALRTQWNERPISAECPLAVTLVAYRPRRIGDLDNVRKAVLDVLQGVDRVLENDSCIVEDHGFRRDDKDNPRVVVILTNPGAPVSLRGIE